MSSPSPNLSDNGNTIPDSAQEPNLPLTMASSIILTQLPRDATSALAAAGEFPAPKVQVFFKPVNAPAIQKSIVRVAATQRFESVVSWLRRRLGVTERESVFLYVNSTFAPALDEIVGNLHRCFKDSEGRLVVNYSTTPAFG
ncbi:hypothetical protein G7Y89_g5261 [Cudoniella acicularis]|uniref:Ubiquitin-like protein ATG12 n=1 Tax=Cudoniella acicularis TaxID=354080 RepID=A0A8H4RPC7_9HELO|nr:hypothetical protein G7Y89_g5261 [Cudoniella acicularis]